MGTLQSATSPLFILALGEGTRVIMSDPRGLRLVCPLLLVDSPHEKGKFFSPKKKKKIRVELMRTVIYAPHRLLTVTSI